jgi:hypothetical protein
MDGTPMPARAEGRMTCITRILTFQDKWQRLDMASDVLLHAALHLRTHLTSPPRLVMDSSYFVDIAASNNLLILSREIYQDSFIVTCKSLKELTDKIKISL